MGVTNIYFVRHAQSDSKVKEDATRPLTAKGTNDAKRVAEMLKDLDIHKIFSSPYQRTMATVKDLAEALRQEIVAVDDFRERRVGEWVEDFPAFSRQQWTDFAYKLVDGESLAETQARNISALHAVLRDNEGMNLVIGTHGTAMSTVINYYDPAYGFEQFWGIVGKMPYILHLQFQGIELLNMEEIEWRSEFV